MDYLNFNFSLGLSNCARQADLAISFKWSLWIYLDL